VNSKPSEFTSNADPKKKIKPDATTTNEAMIQRKNLRSPVTAVGFRYNLPRKSESPFLKRLRRSNSEYASYAVPYSTRFRNSVMDVCSSCAALKGLQDHDPPDSRTKGKKMMTESGFIIAPSNWFQRMPTLHCTTHLSAFRSGNAAQAIYVAHR
jgi:hypothetical protein